MARESTYFLMKLFVRKARERGAERALASLTGAELKELQYLLVKAGLALYEVDEVIEPVV